MLELFHSSLEIRLISIHNSKVFLKNKSRESLPICSNKWMNERRNRIAITCVWPAIIKMGKLDDGVDVSCKSSQETLSGKSRMWKVRRGDNQPVCYNHRVFVSTIIYSAASPARRKVETRAPVMSDAFITRDRG